MVWFTNLVMTHDHRRGFPFFSKVETFLSIVQHVHYTCCLHMRKLSYLYIKSLLSKKKKVKYVHLSILRNFLSTSNLRECCLGKNSGLNCL